MKVKDKLSAALAIAGITATVIYVAWVLSMDLQPDPYAGCEADYVYIAAADMCIVSTVCDLEQDHYRSVTHRFKDFEDNCYEWQASESLKKSIRVGTEAAQSDGIWTSSGADGERSGTYVPQKKEPNDELVSNPKAKVH